MLLLARWASVTLILVVVAGCAVESEQDTTDDAPLGTPWTLADPAPDEDGQLKVLVLHDMEGLSGQSDPRTFPIATRSSTRRGRST